MADNGWGDKRQMFLDQVTSIGHEGGYANNPDDPGGETKYGISRKFLIEAYSGVDKVFKGNTGAEIDIENLSEEDAHTIYRKEFMPAVEKNYGENQFTLKMADIAINAGAGMATEIMQRSLQDMGEDVEADGKMGDITRQAFSRAFAEDPDKLMKSVIKHQTSFYTGEGVDNEEYKPFETKNISDKVRESFKGGWETRAKKTFKDISSVNMVQEVMDSAAKDNIFEVRR